MRAIIVDDEPSGRNSLKMLLEQHCPDVSVMALCSSPAEALVAIQQHKPDLVFLDIEMPDETGIDLLRRLKNIDFGVIFVTAYDKYAIQAIRLNALDYLLKPVRAEDLIAATGKAAQRPKKEMTELISTLLKNYGSRIEKLAIPVRDGYQYIDVKEVVRCEADANYTNIFLANKTKILSSKTLGEYEDMLDGFDFFRAHRSHLINMYHVKGYTKADGGGVSMSDGVDVPLSRKKLEEFLAKINPAKS